MQFTATHLEKDDFGNESEKNDAASLVFDDNLIVKRIFNLNFNH